MLMVESGNSSDNGNGGGGRELSSLHAFWCKTAEVQKVCLCGEKRDTRPPHIKKCVGLLYFTTFV